MRSRYCAYVMLQTDYLLTSWHASTRPATLELDEKAKWLGLKIIATEAGQASDDKGTVEFIARFKIKGKAHRLHEKSVFQRENDRWYYIDGQSHG